MAVCFVGEVLSNLLPFPIPASVYGLMLMLIALKTGIYRLEQVRETGMFFVGILTILFVPAAVGVMEQWEVLKNILWPCIFATIFVTALVIVVTGKFTQWIHQITEKRNNE